MLKCLQLSILLTVFSITAAFAIDLTKVKIISAEKLDYKDGNSILIGNVKVQLGDYFITAPKVFIDSDDSGKPSQARFIEDVFLESDEINIHSPRMVIDLQNTLLKCFSSGDDIVQTTITDKNNKQAVILTWYQEFDYKSGFAKASSQKSTDSIPSVSSYGKSMKQTIFVYDKLQVESDDIEMQITDGNVDYTVFLGDAVAIDDSQRTEAQEIYFFPDKDLLKAEGDVRIVYPDKDAPAYLFSDVVIYEKEKKIMSAFSTSNKPNSKIYRVNAFGQGRQIVLNLDENQKPDNAIITGMAYSQIDDKALSGHELLFNIKDQSLKTLVGRPKTLLFSVTEPEPQEKKSKKNKS